MVVSVSPRDTRMIPPEASGSRSAGAGAVYARGTAVEQLAPETVGVASGFGAAGEVAVGSHGDVVEAATDGQVLIAVAEVEDLESRVGQRLTAGTPGAGNKGTIGKLLAQRRGPCGTRRCG